MPQSVSQLGIAVLAAFAAFVFTIALWPFFADIPLFPFLFAVLVAAWYGGYRAAALALVLSIAGGTYLSRGQVADRDLLARSVTIVIAGLAAAKMGRGFRRVAAQAEQRATEANRLLSRIEAQSQEKQWLYGAEHKARLRAEAAERRFRFLASAGSALAATATRGDTRETLTRLVVEGFAEWAILLGPGDVAPISAQREPERAETVGALARLCLTPDSTPLCPACRTRTPSAHSHHVDSSATSAASSLLRDLETEFWMAVPLGENAGNGLLLAGCAREIEAEELALAQELASDASGALATSQLIQVSQEAARAKTDFLAIMSHELRTPLTAIIGYTDLLEAGVTGTVTDAQRSQLSRIGMSAWRLLGLIDEVLTYTKLQLGLGESHSLPVNIAQLAREAVEHTRAMADAKGLSIHLDVASTTVQTDPYKVRHIMDALVGNAVKFTDSGSVSIRGEVKDGSLIYEVEDTGVGIPEGAFEHIFEPFTQVEDALTRKFGGVGLGLALTHRLARLLGGDLTVRSALGQGSIFTVRLPVQVSRATRDLPLPPLTRTRR